MTRLKVRRLHLWVSGRVQGVFFRGSCEAEAKRCGVKGWVRNLEDGRVEAVFEGSGDAVARMAQWCRRGPPGAVVRGVEEIDEPPTGEFGGFEIIP